MWDEGEYFQFAKGGILRVFAHFHARQVKDEHVQKPTGATTSIATPLQGIEDIDRVSVESTRRRKRKEPDVTVLIPTPSGFGDDGSPAPVGQREKARDSVLSETRSTSPFSRLTSQQPEKVSKVKKREAVNTGKDLSCGHSGLPYPNDHKGAKLKFVPLTKGRFDH